MYMYLWGVQHCMCMCRMFGTDSNNSDTLILYGTSTLWWCLSCKNRINNFKKRIAILTSGLRAINLKLNITSDDCPNSSVTVTTSSCMSVPNLSIPTFSGKEHFFAGPPSNEHITDTGLLFDLQKNV